MEKQIFTQKQTGDRLAASEWNTLTAYANDIVDEVGRVDGKISNLKDLIVIPQAFYIFERAAEVYIDIKGNQLSVAEINQNIISEDNSTVPKTYYTKYVKTKYITPAGALVPLSTPCTYIYSTDLENMFELDRDAHQSTFLNNLISNGGEFFTVNGVQYTITSVGAQESNEVNDVVVLKPESAIPIGTSKTRECVKLSDLIDLADQKSSLTSIVDRFKLNFVKPTALYIYMEGSDHYDTLTGRSISVPVPTYEPEPAQPYIPGASNNSGTSVGIPDPIRTVSQNNFDTYVKTQSGTYLGTSYNCTYIYSTDLEKFFDINTSSGAHSQKDIEDLAFISKLYNEGEATFEYNNQNYIIVTSSDKINDIVMIRPSVALGDGTGKAKIDVKLSELITLVNYMKENNQGPWA